jgi:hypothetical protein
MEISIKTTPVQKYPVIKNRLAIISHIPNFQTFDIEVNAVGLQDTDTPLNVLKGDTIEVQKPVMDYIFKINSVSGAKLLLTPHHLWINRSYVGDSQERPGADPDPLARSELINGFGNFVEILRTATTVGGVFHEINAINWKDPMLYDPAKVNWKTHPTLFWKETCRTRDGRIVNPGNNLDCIIPMLKRKPHLWIHDSFVELFPVRPDGYILRGASVYSADMVALRLARKPGELIEPTSWHLKTGSVIPPV